MNPFQLFSHYPVGVRFGALFSRPGRFCTPFLCLWIYGLAVGEGLTVKFLSNNFIVKHLSPASYPMYLFHWPLGCYWFYLTRLATFKNADEVDEAWYAGLEQGVLIPLKWWEFPILVVVVTVWSWFVTNYLNEKATLMYQKIFNCGYFWCCCLCAGVGCRRGSSDGEEEDTLVTVADAISGLTGADVDATSLLTEIGLDSFGAGALVGLLVSRIPGLQLRAVDVYKMQTVGDLVNFIDKSGRASVSHESSGANSV